MEGALQGWQCYVYDCAVDKRHAGGENGRNQDPGAFAWLCSARSNAGCRSFTRGFDGHHHSLVNPEPLCVNSHGMRRLSNRSGCARHKDTHSSHPSIPMVTPHELIVRAIHGCNLPPVYFSGVTTTSLLLSFARKSSPVPMCWFTSREGVCASHSPSEMSWYSAVGNTSRNIRSVSPRFSM